MIRIDEFLLLLGQQRRIDEFATQRHHCDVLEAQERFIAELERGFDFFDHDDVWICCVSIKTLSMSECREDGVGIRMRMVAYFLCGYRSRCPRSNLARRR